MIASGLAWFGVFLAGSLVPTTASAHVKWFSHYRYDQPPVGFRELAGPTFWFLFALSVVTVAAIVYADRKLATWEPYRRFDRYLEGFSDRATVILRIFTGASLLLAWQGDSMIAPELKIPSQGAGWYQFALALLLLGARTTAVAGAGMIGLYFYAMTSHGIFHLLDYVVYPAIGFYFLVSTSRKARLRGTGIPALYLGLGLSLCWVALEKMFYPNWGLEALSRAPGLTMGLDHPFFLLSCAFIEFSLGYMLIIGLIERPLALTVTGVFFTTTSFFGKIEVVGHTLLHGALLVFIVVGTGAVYRPPIDFHNRLGLRTAFGAVNFVILFALLAFAYHAFSVHAYTHGGVR